MSVAFVLYGTGAFLLKIPIGDGGILKFPRPHPKKGQGIFNPGRRKINFPPSPIEKEVKNV